MGRIVICLLVVFGSLNVQAQLRRDFAQIYRSGPYFNPGFTGIEDYTEINASMQQAWTDSDENASFFLSAYGRIGNFEPTVYENNSLRISKPGYYQQITRNSRKVHRKHGLGGRLTTLSVGPLIQQQLMMSYAYHLPVSSRIRLSFGTNIAFTNESLDMDNYTVRNEADDLFFQDLVSQGDGRSNYLDASFGFLLYSDKFFAGVSGRSLLTAELNNSLEVESLEPLPIYTIMGGFNLTLSPSILLRPGLKMDFTSGSDPVIQPNLTMRWKESFTLGAYYSTGKAVTIALGLQVSDRLRLGYSYDHYISDLSILNRSNHEVTLSFFINNKYGLAAYLW